MIAGDRDRFAIESLPVQPGAVLARQLPNARWAGLRIWAAGQCLTEHVVGASATAETTIYVDVRPLAEWFLSNLAYMLQERGSRFFGAEGDAFRILERWQIGAERRFSRMRTATPEEDRDDDRRFAWATRHFLRFADTGAALPDLAFIAAEGGIEIAWAPRSSADGRLRFGAERGAIEVPREQFLLALAPLVAASATELPAETTAVSALDVLNEASELTWERALEAADPAEVELIHGLRHSSRGAPADDPAFLASRHLTPAPGALDALIELQEATSRQQASAEPALQPDPPFGGSVEEHGYDAALRLRNALGLDGQPLSDTALGSALERIGIARLGDIDGDRTNRMVCGRGASGAAAMALIVDSSARPWTRRMDTARALGRLCLDRPRHGRVVGAGASRVSVGPEHRRAGAFAAQLLLPETGIRLLVGSEPDAAADPGRFTQLMDTYGVGARTTAYHLWNRGFLSSEAVRDDLIDTYAGQPGW